jgi:hypothetical protein
MNRAALYFVRLSFSTAFFPISFFADLRAVFDSGEQNAEPLLPYYLQVSRANFPLS